MTFPPCDRVHEGGARAEGSQLTDVDAVVVPVGPGHVVVDIGVDASHVGWSSTVCLAVVAESLKGHRRRGRTLGARVVVSNSCGVTMGRDG